MRVTQKNQRLQCTKAKAVEERRTFEELQEDLEYRRKNVQEIPDTNLTEPQAQARSYTHPCGTDAKDMCRGKRAAASSEHVHVWRPPTVPAARGAACGCALVERQQEEQQPWMASRLEAAGLAQGALGVVLVVDTVGRSGLSNPAVDARIPQLCHT